MNFDRVELWKVTANDGKVYSTTATTKYSISRGTQQRTSEENSHMRQQLERNNQLMAAIQISSEEFDLDAKIAAELYGLTSLDNKHLKKKKMDDLRDKQKAGEIESPFSYPETCEVGYNSLGEYTKALSNVTYDEIDIFDKI